MPGKRLVQFEKVPHTLEIQGRFAEQLKAQYDVAGPVPHRLAELLEQLAQLELLKELTQLMDEPDSKGGKSKSSRAGLSGPGRYWPVSGPSGRFLKNTVAGIECGESTTPLQPQPDLGFMSFDMHVDAGDAPWMQSISEKGPKRACGWQRNSGGIIRAAFISWTWRKISRGGPLNSKGMSCPRNNSSNSPEPAITSSRSRPPQLAVSFILNHACNVAYWHKADIPMCSANVCFWE